MVSIFSFLSVAGESTSRQGGRKCAGYAPGKGGGVASRGAQFGVTRKKGGDTRILASPPFLRVAQRMARRPRLRSGTRSRPPPSPQPPSPRAS